MHAVTRGIILTTWRAKDAAGHRLATPLEDTCLPSLLRIVAGAAVLKDAGLYIVGAIIIRSLADFVGLPTYKEWNCV